MMLNLSPRLAGAREHHERLTLFYGLGLDTQNISTRHRLMLAAIQSCRAMIEIMLEAAKEQELPAFQNANRQLSRKDFENYIQPHIPYYFLIEKIRIHDFHRFGVLPATPGLDRLQFGGPIKLKAAHGMATLSVRESIEITQTGQSKIDMQRPLLQRNESFYDEESNKYVSLTEIVESFLAESAGIMLIFENSFTMCTRG